MRRKYPSRAYGKLPTSAGESIRVFLPPLSRDQFQEQFNCRVPCDSNLFWFVPPESARAYAEEFGVAWTGEDWLCEHCLDLD